MLILTCGFLGGKYPRHFLFKFCQWISFTFFSPLEKFKKRVQNSSFLCSFYLSNFYTHRFQIVTCVIWINSPFINILMLVTL